MSISNEVPSLKWEQRQSVLEEASKIQLDDRSTQSYFDEDVPHAGNEDLSGIPVHGGPTVDAGGESFDT